MFTQERCSFIYSSQITGRIGTHGVSDVDNQQAVMHVLGVEQVVFPQRVEVRQERLREQGQGVSIPHYVITPSRSFQQQNCIASSPITHHCNMLSVTSIYEDAWGDTIALTTAA